MLFRSDVIGFIAGRFKLIKASYKFIDRETGLVEISKGSYEKVI